MKWIPGLLLPRLLWQFLPAEDDLPVVVQKIADVEPNLPWFWCPPLKGSLDMRRQRRRAFWTDFATAFRFQRNRAQTDKRRNGKLDDGICQLPSFRSR